MKRLIALTTMIVGALFLTGCDIIGDGFLGGDNNEYNVWYDEMMGELHLSYNFGSPETTEDGTVIEEFYFVLYKDQETGEWVEIVELDSYKADDLIIPVQFNQFGDIEITLEVRDSSGTLINEFGVFNIYVNEPQFIYHFNAWFDSWSGLVQFDFGINEFKVKTIAIQKSSDGGITWEDVLTESVETSEDGMYKNQIQYYEYDENNYVFRMIAFDDQNEQLQTMNTWGEINVSYENKNFEGDPYVYYVSAGLDIYSRSVNIWWDAQGAFDKFLVEKSVDLENWEVVGEVPRIGTNMNYTEEVDGEYFYRVSAITGEDVANSFVSEEPVRVKDGLLLGYFDGWIQWDSQTVNLNWDFQTEEEVTVRLERAVFDGPFELVEEFGGLKKMYEDQNLPAGSYIYRVSILNVDGEVLDSLDSQEFFIEAPQHVHHLNAWFDHGTGEIHFDFGVNNEFVTNFVIEKSNDGGLTWTEFLAQDIELDTTNNWYKNNVKAYEFEEGTYTYKIKGFDSDGNFLGEALSWGEVYVEFYNLNLEGDAEIYHVDGNFNIYDKAIHLWWNGQGEYDKHIIEVSVDGENWIIIQEAHRVATHAQLTELVDGEYYIRVSALDDTGNVLHSRQVENTIRVKQDAIIGSFNGWVQWDTQSISLNWDFLTDQEITIMLERKNTEDDVYELVEEFGGLKQMYVDEKLSAGTYVYKLSVKDVDGNVLDEVESGEFTIEQQQHVYHINAWFNQSTGEIHFDFGFNADFVTTYVIEKSSDGGLTFEQYLTENVEFTDNWYINQIRTYELVEGAYAYRILGYDVNGEFVGEAYTYHETVVEYHNLNFEEPTEIYYIEGNYNIYDNSINLWWNSQGDYDRHAIEISLDGVNYNALKEVPRVATFTQVTDLPDGEYYFRISAIDVDGNIVHSNAMENKVRVKHDALIGSFDGWYDYDRQEVNLYWDFIREDVAFVKVERRLADEVTFTELGQFGPLKTTYEDSLTVAGTYVYKLVLLDEDGVVLDELESRDFVLNITE